MNDHDTDARWGTLQSWFLKVVRSPLDESKSDEDVERVIASRLTASDAESATERLAIYRRAYFARLEECLADDFKAVRAGLGDESFSALAREYVLARPSRSFSLNFFGAEFPSFLRDRGRAYFADLAALEWALVEAVHSAQTPSTLAEDLALLGEEGLASALLLVSPSAQILDSEYPVNAALQRFFSDDRTPEVPDAVSPSSVLVVRSGYRLWRLDLEPRQRLLLEAIRRGEPLSDALTTLDVTSEEIQSWFALWAEKGVLVGARRAKARN